MITQYTLLPRGLFLGALILLLASISIHAFGADTMHKGEGSTKETELSADQKRIQQSKKLTTEEGGVAATAVSISNDDLEAFLETVDCLFEIGPTTTLEEVFAKHPLGRYTEREDIRNLKNISSVEERRCASGFEQMNRFYFRNKQFFTGRVRVFRIENRSYAQRVAEYALQKLVKIGVCREIWYQPQRSEWPLKVSDLPLEMEFIWLCESSSNTSFTSFLLSLDVDLPFDEGESERYSVCLARVDAPEERTHTVEGVEDLEFLTDPTAALAAWGVSMPEGWHPEKDSWGTLEEVEAVEKEKSVSTSLSEPVVEVEGDIGEDCTIQDNTVRPVEPAQRKEQADKESRERVHAFLRMENPPRVQSEFAKILRPEDVDLLYPVLDDLSMQWRWSYVVAAIVALEPQQTRAFNRVVEWVKTGPVEEELVTHQKISSIKFLGFLSPEVSFDFLYELFLSDASIKEFLIPYENSGEFKDWQLYEFVRYAAGDGIVNFNDKAIFDRIEALLENLQGRPLSIPEQNTKKFCINVLTYRDLYSEHGGVEKATRFLEKMPLERKGMLLFSYSSKYYKGFKTSVF